MPNRGATPTGRRRTVTCLSLCPSLCSGQATGSTVGHSQVVPEKTIFCCFFCPSISTPVPHTCTQTHTRTCMHTQARAHTHARTGAAAGKRLPRGLWPQTQQVNGGPQGAFSPATDGGAGSHRAHWPCCFLSGKRSPGSVTPAARLLGSELLHLLPETGNWGACRSRVHPPRNPPKSRVLFAGAPAAHRTLSWVSVGVGGG